MTLKVQDASVKNIATIRELTYQIWPQSYGSILTPGQIEYMLNLMYSESALTEQIEHQRHSFIIIYENEVPVGFASYSETGPTRWKLHKIYILPSQQGKGTGKFIIDNIVTAIIALGAKALRLNVNRNNAARFFYEKLGFCIISEEDIDIGGGYFMNDFIMEKQL